MASKQKIYLDSASTTPVHADVLTTYIELLKEKFANSESLYDAGVEMATMMEQSRQHTAQLLGVRSEEIIFTSGASEANNMAIKGIAFSQMKKKRHLVTSKIEHSSVLNAFRELEEVFGFEVTYLDTDEQGIIDLKQLESVLRPDTSLVSLMMVNNEIGTIQPIEDIVRIVKATNHIFLHMDGVQALAKITMDLKRIDCVSFSAHKIHGLKGSGILVCKQHVPLVPLISGGQQEFYRRGGTSNALVNIMFAKTLRLALESSKEATCHCLILRKALIEQLANQKGIVLNSPRDGVCHILNFSCLAVPSEVMLNALNQRGFCVSAQSTCSNKSKAPSAVLKAMGKSDVVALSSIRCSFSFDNSFSDIMDFARVIKECIEKYGI